MQLWHQKSKFQSKNVPTFVLLLFQILDWEYYIERLGGTVMKIITIPAALQNVRLLLWQSRVCVHACVCALYPQLLKLERCIL